MENRRLILTEKLNTYNDLKKQLTEKAINDSVNRDKYSRKDYFYSFSLTKLNGEEIIINSIEEQRELNKFIHSQTEIIKSKLEKIRKCVLPVDQKINELEAEIKQLKYNKECICPLLNDYTFEQKDYIKTMMELKPNEIINYGLIKFHKYYEDKYRLISYLY